MSKHIECRIVDSRLLEPCRAMSQRQPDNHRRDYLSKPPRLVFRAKIQTVETDFVADKWQKLFKTTKIYPLGLWVDITA